MSLFTDGLLPASFRGVPFAVFNSSAQFSRRLAVHQYPGRDTPWTEDLGRGARRIRFAGFIVANDVVYPSGPVAVQRALLLAAAERAGPGTLTHPTLGVLNVCVEGLSITDPLEAGSYAEIEFNFVESGKQSFPSLLSLAGAQIGGVSLATIATVLVDAATVLKAAQGLQTPNPLPARAWAAQVVALGNDATALNRLTASLPGNFGRFAQGGNTGFSGAGVSVYSSDTAIAELVSDASAQRAAVRDAAAAFTVATDPTVIASAAATLVTALLSSCADPADGLRLFGQLTLFSGGSDAISAATDDMLRRLSVCAMARAVALYQPSSYDDAFIKLATVTAAIDAAITIAGDRGLDDTFNALDALRVAVVTDLRTRGGLLAHIRKFTFGASLPDVVLAQRLYRDAARADQLLTQAAGTPHPLFMPATLYALAV